MHLEELGIPFTDLGEQKEIELFWHISQSLVSKTELKDILQLIVTMSAGVMRSKICSIMLLDEASGELRIAATQSLSSEYADKPPVRVGESVSGRAVKERRAVTVLDVVKDPDYRFPDLAKKEGIVSMISVPMIIGTRVIGVINSYSTEPHQYTGLEVKVLRTVANQAALAIENATLRADSVAARKALAEGTVISQAKTLIMEKDGCKESEALARLEETARISHRSISEVAEAVTLAYRMKV